MDPYYQKFINLEYFLNKIYQIVISVKNFFGRLFFGGGDSGSGSGGVSGGYGYGGNDGASGSGGFWSSLFGGGGSSSDSSSGYGSYADGGNSGLSIFGFLADIDPLLKGLFELLTLMFLTGIIYALVRIYEIRKEENRKTKEISDSIESTPFKNEQWEIVLEHMRSPMSSDWRLAIIEADNMLDNMVKKMGYEGEDLGERLRAVERSDFESLDNAWEAHKVRNKIVHEGTGFELSRHEAERIVGLYEKVFREFEYI